MARRLSEAYRKAAQENHSLLADVGRRFYELSESQELYAADGVHPNEPGSRMAARLLSEVILQHKENPL